MQERKRAEAVGRQENGTTAALTIAHTDAMLHADGGHGGDDGLHPLGTSGELTPSGTSASASPTARSMYLAKRTSIVDGLSAHELLMQHRRSLIGLPVGLTDSSTTTGQEARPAIADLEGVTLSKRHTYTKTEYDAGANAAKFEELKSFKLGFDEDGDAAAAAAEAASGGGDTST